MLPRADRNCWQPASAGTLAAAGFLAVLVLVSLAAWLALAAGHLDPLATDLGSVLRAPSVAHWLGTDDLGRDVAARLVHGARSSLGVGVIATTVAFLVGLALGTAAGLAGGWWDLAVSRALEVVQTFPVLLLVLAVLAALPHPGRSAVALVLGLTRSVELARLARGEALRVRTLEFVAAARAMGSPAWRILVTHVVPHAVGPVLVASALGLGGLILAESALAFLGLGAPPPAPSWGELLLQAREHPEAWWLVVAPGALLVMTVASANQLADAARDHLSGVDRLRPARKLRAPQRSS